MITKKRSQKEESTETNADQKYKNMITKKRSREEESTETTTDQQNKDTLSKKQKHQYIQQTTVNNVFDDKEIKLLIEHLMKNAKHVLQRTKDPEN
jgi:hypothetical protein